APTLLRLPLARRVALMHWAVSSHQLSTLAAAVSPRARVRQVAAHALAGVAGDTVNPVLQMLLNDKNMAVRITTMDVLWKRRPTPAMLRSLWRRAIVLGPQHPDIAGFPASVVKFRGHLIRIFGPMMMVHTDSGPWWGVQDGPLACRLLCHWKPLAPESTNLVVHYLARTCRRALAKPGQAGLDLMPWQIKPFRQAALLNPQRVAPYLLYLVHRPLPKDIDQLDFNSLLMAKGHFASNRTLPLEMLVWLAHQKITAYHLSIFTVELNGGIPILTSGGKAQEGQDIKRITRWFTAQGIHAATPAEFQKRADLGGVRPAPGTGSGQGGARLSLSQSQRLVMAEGEFWHGLTTLAPKVAPVRRAAFEQIQRALVTMTTDLIRLAPMSHPRRVVHLLRYQRRLATLATMIMGASPSRRQSLVRWAFSPAVWPRLGQIGSERAAQRVAVGRWLGATAGSSSRWMLQRLLTDRSVLVRITAMNGLWNCNPSSEAIAAVWQMAVGLHSPALTAVFRGHTLTPPVRPEPSFMYAATPAMQLLQHWNVSSVALNKTVVAYLKSLCARRNKRLRVIQTHFIHFLKRLHSLQAAPYLLYLADRPRRPGLATMYQGHVVSSSNRTLPLACLVILAGKRPTSYHLIFSAGRWWVGTVAQENEGVKKVTAWYKARGIHAGHS
ncbi:MAG: hypothetical protein HKL95_08665, partial [Phycisphaerae bacterium]|nr:hypothetical protein [Phycisphaerae bacterium]